MTSPSPTPADPSTDSDIDDESQDDPTQGGDGLPPDNNNTPSQPLTITPELAASAGLGDLKVGDTFAVTIHGTVTDNTDGTITADVEDAMDGMKMPGDAATPPPMKKPQSAVVSPADAGFRDGSGNPMS